MKTLLRYSIFVAIALSCVRAKPQETITPISGVEENILRSECLAIGESGDIYGLLSQIKADTRKVLSYLDKKDPREYSPRIEFLAERILENAELVKNLARGSWNTPVGESIIDWRLNPSATSAEIMEVYFQGQKRDDLLKNISIVPTEEGLKVSYQSTVTYLEYCQFNRTLLVVVRVKYHGKKAKFFNLYVDPENEK